MAADHDVEASPKDVSCKEVCVCVCVCVSPFQNVPHAPHNLLQVGFDRVEQQDALFGNLVVPETMTFRLDEKVTYEFRLTIA